MLLQFVINEEIFAFGFVGTLLTILLIMKYLLMLFQTDICLETFVTDFANNVIICRMINSTLAKVPLELKNFRLKKITDTILYILFCLYQCKHYKLIIYFLVNYWLF